MLLVAKIQRLIRAPPTPYLKAMMKPSLVILLAACVATSVVAAEPKAHRSSAHFNFTVGPKGLHGKPRDVCAPPVIALPGNMVAKRPSGTAGNLSVSVDSPLGRLRVVTEKDLASVVGSVAAADGATSIIVLDRALVSEGEVRQIGNVPVRSARRAKASAGSALYTRGTPAVSRFVTRIGDATLTLLATDGEDMVVLGGILDEKNEAGARRSSAFVVERSGMQVQDHKDLLELTTLEHLYALVLEREPTGSFSLGTANAFSKAGRRNVHGQWGVLRSIAVARECAAARLGSWAGSNGMKLWHTVALKWSESESSPEGHGEDSVAVRAGNHRGAIVGAGVTFSRAPHMVCSAVTDGAGRAACNLVDAHGHDESHEDEGAPVAVAFSGVVGPGSIDLPTTAVFSKR